MAEIEKNDTGSSENSTASTGFTPMSGSEMDSQRKSRKKELIAAAIGEGISSLSNLFFASKGAPWSKSSSTKQRQPTLMERIYGRHKEEDKAYNANLTAWEKEQEKKRKEAEKLAKENDVIEDIHPDFRPKVKNWEKKVYVDVLYSQLRNEIKKNALEYNRKKKKGTIRIDKNGSTFIPSDESSVIDYMDTFYTEGSAGRHMKAELIREILSGDYQNDELSDEWLDQFRKTAQEDHDNWIDYK